MLVYFLLIFYLLSVISYLSRTSGAVVETAVIVLRTSSFALRTVAFYVRLAPPDGEPLGMDCAVSITPKQNEKSDKTQKMCLVTFLVETAVIETASENPFSKLSTSVADLLTFPFNHAEMQA